MTGWRGGGLPWQTAVSLHVSLAACAGAWFEAASRTTPLSRATAYRIHQRNAGSAGLQEKLWVMHTTMLAVMLHRPLLQRLPASPVDVHRNMRSDAIPRCMKREAIDRAQRTHLSFTGRVDDSFHEAALALVCMTPEEEASISPWATDLDEPRVARQRVGLSSK